MLCIRAFLRAAETNFRRDRPALVTASGAIPVTFELVRLGLVPSLVAMLIFSGRTFAPLVIVRPAWRARTLGMVEASRGVLFVIGIRVALMKTARNAHRIAVYAKQVIHFPTILGH